MRRLYTLIAAALLSTVLLFSCKSPGGKDDEKEGYDGPAARDLHEFNKVLDPALGYVPYDRLYAAMEYTESRKAELLPLRMQQALTWQERGPIYDTVGPSNGNTRAGFNYTSGRIRAVLVDTLNDPTGNTVFAGGVAGGLWKCTNFLSTIPNWQVVNDFFDNMAISSICQNPANPAVMYFSTGEATSNADAVLGKGVWKSTNAGTTWTRLTNTANIIRSFKMACDNAGNVYLAARPTASPAANANGLLRSTDGGNTWENITPTAVGTATATATCTDIEISSTGKLLASFGYTGTIVRAFVAAAPSTVSPSSGWTLGTGIRLSGASAYRLELATLGDIAYAVTINPSNSNADSCYRSIDGGLNWEKQNTTLLPSGLANGQGWYNLTLAINPLNDNEIIAGGLDAYRSSNGGADWIKITNWVTASPYVHADHHFMQWTIKNGESRLLIGCDGGLFLSRDAGLTFSDKNRNLAIKQFYSAAIHPDAGSNYLLAGAQDNGTHQLKYPGLASSIEVTGGDGCFVHINQQNPQIQFGSYVYNQYRRSTNGGQTWSQLNLSGSQGLFVNPFDYDDAQNILYASNGLSQVRRLNDAHTATAAASITFNITALGGGNTTAVKVSPHTPNRVFLGTSQGKVVRLDNANTVTSADVDANATNITGTFPAGTVNCINVGTTDNNLVAVMTNYGINNIWVSSNGGSTWTAADGNLPDMPVRWAIFEPGRNDRLVLATETGVFTTDLVNGAGTVWEPNPTFPTVRTDMLKMRISDSTIVAATHGRGLFTAKINGGAAVCSGASFLSQPANATICTGNNTSFSASASGTALTYQWQVSTDGGAIFSNVTNGGVYSGATTGLLLINNATVSMNNYRYRLVVNGTCTPANTASTPGTLTVNTPPTVTLQPDATKVGCSGSSVTFTVGGSGSSTYQWQVSTDGGANYSNIAGATSGTLSLTNIQNAQSGYRYRAVLSAGSCGGVLSNAGVLTVNPTPVVTQQPEATKAVCVGSSTSFTAVATGSPSYQWQVSTNGGTTYTDIAGANSGTLTLNNVAASQNGNRYRVALSAGSCNSLSNHGTLVVNPLPTVGITATPGNTLVPGTTTQLKATSSPMGNAYAWKYNGNPLVTATTDAVTVNLNTIGTYQVTVTDINGCINTSAITSITAAVSDKLFIYPNPSTGRFTVQLYANGEHDERTVGVYDAKGVRVAWQKVVLGSSSNAYPPVVFDLPGVASGVYNVIVTHKTSKKVISGKVLIRH